MGALDMHGMNMWLVAGVCNLCKYMSERVDDGGDVIIGYITNAVYPKNILKDIKENILPIIINHISKRNGKLVLV